MKKIVGFLFIPIWVLCFIVSVILIIAYEIYENIAYKYPFNSFDKVAETMALSRNHHNLIYIMADMTNGFDITSILQANLQLSKNFTGFTNYENLITSNFATNASVPNIFGGYDFNPYYKNNETGNKSTLRQYMHKAIEVLISAFGSANWDISCIANQYYNYDVAKSYWDSDWRTVESDFSQYHVQAINANDISRLLFSQQLDLYHQLNLPYKVFDQASNANYVPIIPYLSQANIINTNNNKFFEIMNEATHVPIVLDQNGHYQANITNTPLNLYNSFTGFLTQVAGLITYLKTNSIYDNTMIVIDSDHGNSQKSIVLSDSSYNHSGINYQAINDVQAKYSDFNRYFPTLLIKPYNNNNAIVYNNENLYANTDILSFIKENNQDQVNFATLDQTKDKRYLKQLSAISQRRNTYMPSYGVDYSWDDNYTDYVLPNSGLGTNSYLVKDNIYDLNNWLISKDRDDYYNPDDLTKWEQI